MNILIITGYTKNVMWDNYGDCNYGKLSSTNHLEYSQLHNYSYLSNIVDENDYQDRHLTWVKIDIIRKNISGYDYVVWIDNDAVFMNMETRIEEFLSNEPDLVLTKMEIDRNYNKVWTNCSTGFMVWRNIQWSVDLLNDMWDNPGEFRYDAFHEQSLLDHLLLEHYKLNSNILNREEDDIDEPVLLNNILVLPYKYQQCYPMANYKFIYHASGNTHTKYERIRDSLK